MRETMYKDCNNNIFFLKGIFFQVQKFSNTELNWKISNLDFIPVDKGDFVNGVPSIEMEELYDFQKRILEEYSINVRHNTLMELLKNIKTIYDGVFVALIDGKKFKIKVFDGDIIEIDGEMEDYIIF